MNNVTHSTINKTDVLKHLLHFSIGGMFIVFMFTFSACDDISVTSESSAASLESLTISPNSIQFDDSSPIGNQTVQIELILTLEEPADSDFRYTVERRGLLVTEGTFTAEAGSEYSADLSLTVNTANNFNYTVYAFQADDTAGERIQGGLTIRGRTVSPPIIEEAFNTEEVTIPDEGNVRVDFFARVFHPDNQEFIDKVNFFMIDSQGIAVGGEFEMFDDGVFNETEGFIDEAAGDSLYSRAFFVNPGNSPAEISVFYFAIGIDGQSSDTLQTELRIAE